MKEISSYQNYDSIIQSKYKYAFLLSAVGDSLGWPLEFSKRKKSKIVETFYPWKKTIGGKWWGYIDEIKAGEYSDDTQLNLAVARAINSKGEFDPEYFAYLELPLWLGYERGGGTSLKTAAKNLLKKKFLWNSNFYKTSRANYFLAGANGSAMRNLPIALLGINNEKKFTIDSFKNAIITHGHPRAIVGSLLIGSTIIFFLKKKEIKLNEYLDYIRDILNNSLETAKKDKIITNWITYVNKCGAFNTKYKETIKEAEHFLLNIKKYLTKEDPEFYEFTKAFKREFKGSGITTTVVAIYMAIKYLEKPYGAIIKSINMLGSDTDTIGNFVGSILGAYYGEKLKESQLYELILQIQDKKYFETIAEMLFKILNKNLNVTEGSKISKHEALLRILAWEIGLHEMFWEALKEGDTVIHPTLGKGIISKKYIQKIRRREDYLAKIFRITFQSGQTAYFHSRVSKEGFVKQSMSEEIQKFIK